MITVSGVASESGYRKYTIFNGQVSSLKTKKYEIECPECKAVLILNIKRECMQMPIKGVYEDVVKVRKSNQSKLT